MTASFFEEHEHLSPPIWIVGIGNDYRSDDRVGLVVVRALQALQLPGTVVMECPAIDPVFVEMWRAASLVILVDAAAVATTVGTIHRIDVLTRPLPEQLAFPSTHSFGIVEALALARTLELLPPALVIYAIEGVNFDMGTCLSPEVEQAAHNVMQQIVAEVTRHACARPHPS